MNENNEDNVLFLDVNNQHYTCIPSNNDFNWIFLTPSGYFIPDKDEDGNIFLNIILSGNGIIINSVASSGINILNEDIEIQFLVGKFDPFAFQQYIGRVRNYKGVIYYLYNEYGKNKAQWDNITNKDKFIADYQYKLDYFTENTEREVF